MIRIRHTGIVVSDIDRSIEFYGDLLGFKILKDNVESGEYIDVFLGMDNTVVRTVKMVLDTGDMVELLSYETNKRQGQTERINQIGCTHIALTVDNLDYTYERFLEHGVEFINAPFVSADGLAKVAFCRDPDGFFIELVEEVYEDRDYAR